MSIKCSSTFGRHLKVTIFGGSHEEEIGVTITGLPIGQWIDFDKMQELLNRRAPGNSIYATSRKEPDLPLVRSGLIDGKTTKEPLTIIIKNTNIHSKDYESVCDVPRPGHGDYTAMVKYKGSVNISGGGPFSGRMTAPLCIAGAIALQILEKENIHIGAHIYAIGSIFDRGFSEGIEDLTQLNDLKTRSFPVLDEEKGAEMGKYITEVRSQGDSIGGIIECVAIGVKPGIGGPMYDGLESILSPIFFGIPAVKGVEFGTGFASSARKGSENNDAFYMDGNQVKTRTNHHGGILGGISSGMPIICRLGMKPTPSIAKEQDSVSLSRGENTKLSIVGRHDPCVVVRAVPVVEAAMALGILDTMLELGEEDVIREHKN